MPLSQRSLWGKYLLLPLSLFLLCAWLIEHFNVDIRLADFLFHLEGGVSGQGWPWRDAFVTKNILHGVGHDLIVTLGVMVIILTGLSWKLPRLRPYRYGFLYLVISFALTTLLVGLLKSMTHVNCPWDLIDTVAASRLFQRSVRCLRVLSKDVVSLVATRPVGMDGFACFSLPKCTAQVGDISALARLWFWA